MPLNQFHTFEKKASLLKRVGDLYKLIEVTFPSRRSKQGLLDITQLAKEMGYGHETLHRCLRNDIVKVPVALQIIQFSQEVADGPALFWEDLLPLVMPHYQTFSDPNRRASD